MLDKSMKIKSVKTPFTISSGAWTGDFKFPMFSKCKCGKKCEKKCQH